MSKGLLIDAVFKQHSLANKTGKALSKAAIGRIVDSVFEQAGKQIVGKGYFRYPGFGSFLIRDRSARTVFKALPKTKGQTVDRSEANKMTVPARGVVGFKASPQLKESVKDLKRVKRTKVSKKEQEIV